MSRFEQIFEQVRSRTSMYLPEVTFAAAAAFVLGCDVACEGGILPGFREWLVVRLGSGNNLAWPALVLHVAFPEAPNPQDAVRDSATRERHAIDVLFGLIGEFQRIRSTTDGPRRMALDYERWLRTQSWYGLDSPGWIECPCSRAAPGKKKRGRQREKST